MPIDIDKVRELYDFLKNGDIPEGVIVSPRPKLSAKQAWNVIWFLQKLTECLPSNFEKCDVCDGLYDRDSEGFLLDDQYKLKGKTLPKKYWGFYCSNCVPDIDFKLS